MKLLLCRRCQDVIGLASVKRTCICGCTSGKYLNSIDAIYSGDFAIPLGFNNTTLKIAMNNQPEQGLGFDFGAFIIPKNCSTFKKVNEVK